MLQGGQSTRKSRLNSGCSQEDWPPYIAKSSAFPGLLLWHWGKLYLASAFAQVEDNDRLRLACYNVSLFRFVRIRKLGQEHGRRGKNDLAHAFIQVVDSDDLRLASFNVGYLKTDRLFRGLGSRRGRPKCDQQQGLHNNFIGGPKD
jgi:hypothetical protein